MQIDKHYDGEALSDVHDERLMDQLGNGKATHGHHDDQSHDRHP